MTTSATPDAGKPALSGSNQTESGGGTGNPEEPAVGGGVAKKPAAEAGNAFDPKNMMQQFMQSAMQSGDMGGMILAMIVALVMSKENGQGQELARPGVDGDIRIPGEGSNPPEPVVRVTQHDPAKDGMDTLVLSSGFTPQQVAETLGVSATQLDPFMKALAAAQNGSDPLTVTLDIEPFLDKTPLSVASLSTGPKLKVM